MKAPLLSICIPTFNRVLYLKDLVPALLHEIASATDRTGLKIELLVSNNASTDTTEDFLQSIRSPFYYHRKNDHNIGAEGNFFTCINSSSGEYVWLFGDDELIEVGGVEKLITQLVAEAPELIILDHVLNEPRLYPSYKSCLLNEMKQTLDFPLHHTLITANVFKKEIFDIPYAHTKLGLEYAQMFGLMRNSNTFKKIIVMGGIMRTHSKRAPFHSWPFALCVRQGIYLFYLANWTGVKRLYLQAFRTCMNLPVELLSRFIHRFFPSLIERR